VFKIGDFSRISLVPVKTLRYYDQIDLLKPAEVDKWTGYRFYSLDQLTRLNRILVLKDLGFSLEQVAKMLDEDLSLEQMRGMLRMKQAEIEHHLEEERQRLARVEYRLRQLEEEGTTMPEYDIVIKNMEPMRVLTLRDIIPNYQSVGMLFNEAMEAIQRLKLAPVGPPMASYYDDGYKESDVDVEVLFPIADGADMPEDARVKVRDMDGFEAASLMRIGPYDNFRPAYEALLKWVNENGHEVVSPPLEVYVRGPESGVEPDQYMTEIVFPIG